jgi:hypothetical protein
VGIDKGAYASSIVNIFTDQAKAERRMLHLINSAKHRIYIQGISLRSFFGRQQNLYEALFQVAARDHGLTVKILLLNHDSDQAVIRSYREYLIDHSDDDDVLSLVKYRENPSYHKNSDLYRHTEKSIENIAFMVRRLHTGKVICKLYDATPGNFLLIVDDAALVEQYHYGKIPREGYTPNTYSPVLGKDMPLVEYSAMSPRLFSRDPLKDPYRLLRDHFEFVFDHCSAPAPGAADGIATGDLERTLLVHEG